MSLDFFQLVQDTQNLSKQSGLLYPLLAKWSALELDRCQEYGAGWKITGLIEGDILISDCEAKRPLSEHYKMESLQRYALQAAVQIAITDRLGTFLLRGSRNRVEAEVTVLGRESGLVRSPYAVTALLEGYLRTF